MAQAREKKAFMLYGKDIVNLGEKIDKLLHDFPSWDIVSVTQSLDGTGGTVVLIIMQQGDYL